MREINVKSGKKYKARPPCVIHANTNIFFYNRFLDLSLISRFPIYRVFARFGEINSPVGYMQDFPAIFLTCDHSRRNRLSVAVKCCSAPRRILCVFCADFNFSLYGEKIEMDFAAEVVCSRKANPITKQ